MSKSAFVKKNSQKEEEIYKKTNSDQGEVESISPRKKSQYNCFTNTGINGNKKCQDPKKTIPLPKSSVRSRSYDKGHNIDNRISTVKRNLEIETDACLSSKINSIRSKRDLRIEYDNKLKKETKDKSAEKRSISNPNIKQVRKKEISYDSINEDRVKRSAPDEIITRKTVSAVIPTNIIQTSVGNLTNPSVLLESPSNKEKLMLNERKTETVQNLVDKISAIKIKDRESKNDKERNKKLEKFQHKLSVLNEKGKLGFLDNEDKLMSINTEEYKVSDVIRTEEDFDGRSPIDTDKDRVILESSKEQYKSDELSDLPLKTSSNLSRTKNINKTASINYMEKIMSISKSVSNRKPKVDTFEYMNKIKPNMRFDTAESCFRRSFSNENKESEFNLRNETIRKNMPVKINNYVTGSNCETEIENPEYRKRLIVEQKRKRKAEEINKRKNDEEKTKKTYLNLKKLQNEIKSNSVSIPKRRNFVVKNNSNYINKVKEESSLLDDNKYYMDIIEFINENPLGDINCTKTQVNVRLNSAKNLSSKRNSFRESTTEKGSKKENSLTKRKFSSISTSIKQEKEVKLTQLNTVRNDSANMNMEIVTSPKNFEANSLYNPLSTPEVEKISEAKMISHNNFQRFLEEKIKNTVKSIDSNEMRVSNNVNDLYQPQFTAPSNNSIIQGSNTSSAKFGNTNNNTYNAFPHIPEQKNLIIDEKTAKLNEYKKKYDHCIERFKNLTENSINSNISANLSFKKNIQNGPPESNVTQQLQRSNKDVIPEPDFNPSFAEEQIAAKKIQKFIRRHQNRILRSHSKKLKNERYYTDEEIKISENMSESNTITMEKKNSIAEEVESLNHSSQYYFDKNNNNPTQSSHEKQESRSEFLSLHQTLLNTSQQQDHSKGLFLKKPRNILQSHFSSESQFIQFHKELYEANMNSEQISSANESVEKDKYSNKESYYSMNKSINSVKYLREHEPKEKTITSLNVSSASFKRNCYSLVKVPSNNTIILCPNSFDSPKLHRIRLLVEKQKSESSLNSNVSNSRKRGDISNRINPEDELVESDRIIWEKQRADSSKLNISESHEEGSENRVINYSRLSNIDENGSDVNKIEYGIPEESNENDSQINKIQQSGDTEIHGENYSMKEGTIYGSVHFDDKLGRDHVAADLGGVCPENSNRDHLNPMLNLSGQDHDSKETNLQRFEKYSQSSSIPNPCNEPIEETFNEENKSESLSKKFSDRIRSKSDIEAEKDDSNIEWQLTINSDISGKSNPGDSPKLNSLNNSSMPKFEIQKKNSLGEIKEEEENSKQHSNHDVHKDDELEYKEDFEGSIQHSNNDIVDEILNDNEILKDIKFKQEENKEISPKSRNYNIGKEKMVENITDEKNDDLLSVKDDKKLDTLPSSAPSIILTDKKEHMENKNKKQDTDKEIENKRYQDDDDEEDSKVEKENEKKEEINLQNSFNDIKDIKEKDLELLLEEITNKILEESILNELRSQFLPEKHKKDNTNLSVTICLPSEVQNSASIENLSSSVVLKSLESERKEPIYNIYSTEVAPKFIKKIKLSIEDNFHSIVKNLQTPFYNKPSEVIHSIIFKDKNRLLNSYHQVSKEGDPERLGELIHPERIIRNFADENNEIREFGKHLLEYDNILNECIVDSAIENLKKGRLYGNHGEPLPWSCRTRSLQYRFDETNPYSKKKLSSHIETTLLDIIKEQLGILPESIELETDNLNAEREKRLLKVLAKEVVNESENGWKNYEIEETQVKLELSEMVLEQLLNEVVEIMEHVQLSRKNSALYNFKSIYACEEIPRLSFQLNNNLDINDEVNQ